MKRKLFLVAAFVAVCCLSGCVSPTPTPGSTPNSSSATENQSSSTESTDSSSDSSESSPQEETPVINKPGETVKLGNWEITVNSAEVVEIIEGDFNMAFKPDEGNKYVVVNTTAKNIDTNSGTFLPSYSMADDVRAKMYYGEYEFSSTTLLAYDGDLHNTTLNPLSSKTGVVVFSISSDIAVLEDLNIAFLTAEETATFSLV